MRLYPKRDAAAKPSFAAGVRRRVSGTHHSPASPRHGRLHRFHATALAPCLLGCGWPDPFFDYLAVSLDYIHGYTSSLGEEAGVAGRLDQARGGDHDSLESISESFVTNTEMQKCGMLQDANSSKFKSQVQSSQRADSETRNVKTTTGDGGFSKDNHLKVTVIIDDYVNMIQFKYN
ncbi:hypothetical protein QYE76_053160 [Lolium multiflorum]|uniref:Uncharacterized protein n=1 Tax=Lolium multiflorum TaxID=4521 RepID=A0AAD8SWP3_LOLMU|nr:hypothetical protein QYE76_053160 [Lolium multiflorum]